MYEIYIAFLNAIFCIRGQSILRGGGSAKSSQQLKREGVGTDHHVTSQVDGWMQAKRNKSAILKFLNDNTCCYPFGNRSVSAKTIYATFVTYSYFFHTISNCIIVNSVYHIFIVYVPESSYAYSTDHLNLSLG